MRNIFPAITQAIFVKKFCVKILNIVVLISFFYDGIDGVLIEPHSENGFVIKFYLHPAAVVSFPE